MRAFRKNVIPYCPMGPSRKEVSVERMNEILAKRTGAINKDSNIKTERVVQAESANVDERVINRDSAMTEERSLQPEVLQWEIPKSDSHVVTTTCGRYTCSKVWVMGKVQYEIWRLASDGNWFHPVAMQLESFQKAKEAAQKHATDHAGGVNS